MKRGGGRRLQVLPLGQLVDELLAKLGLSGDVRAHRLVTSWKEIAGERLAARAWPDGLKRGVLYVRVANSAWLHELSFLRSALVEKANAVCGTPGLVREVRLHLGAAPETDEDDLVARLARREKKAAARPRVPVPSENLARIEREAVGVKDPELRDIIRNVRKKIGL